MSFNGRAVVAAGLMALAAACGGGSSGGGAGAQKPEEKAAAAQGVSTGDFGVPECDAYIRKYEACINSKVPEAGRAIVKQTLDQTREQWKRAAATPQGKAALATGCAQATAMAKQTMAAYNCQW